MNKFIIAVLFLLAGTQVKAQKVATYATGNPGEEEYESFAFWVKDGSKSFISYTYGADRKEARVSYGGKSVFKGVESFKIQFANKLVLYVMKNGNQLQIANSTGSYLKTFKWEYEGPVNGVGTFCSVCAANEDEAMKMLTDHYLK